VQLEWGGERWVRVVLNGAEREEEGEWDAEDGGGRVKGTMEQEGKERCSGGSGRQDRGGV